MQLDYAKQVFNLQNEVANLKIKLTLAALPQQPPQVVYQPRNDEQVSLLVKEKAQLQRTNVELNNCNLRIKAELAVLQSELSAHKTQTQQLIEQLAQLQQNEKLLRQNVMQLHQQQENLVAKSLYNDLKITCENLKA